MERRRLHKRCAVFGCGNKTPPMFRFPSPKKRLDVFRKWLQAARNPHFVKLSNETVHLRGFTICARHFTQDSYRLDGARLLPSAVPTLHLPNSDGDVLPPMSRVNVIDLNAASFQQVQIDVPQLEDNSNLHLVEGHEILQNLSSFNAKDIDIPETLGQPYIFSKLFQDEDHFLHTCEATKSSKVSACTESESFNLVKLELPVQTEDSPELNRKPYFKSIKSYLLGSKRVTEVCRICFRSLDDEEVIKLYDEPNANQIKNMLNLVLPDLDLNIYPNTVICTKCSELLSHSYKLKETWLRTEEKLQKIIDKRKSVTNRDADLVIAINEHVEDKAEQDLNDGKLNSDTSIEPSRNGKTIKKTEDKTEQNLNDGENMILRNILSQSTSKVISSFYGEPKPVSIFKNIKKNNLWGEGPFICELCGHLYQSVQSLRRHLRLHQKFPNDNLVEGKRNNMCEICGQLCFSLKSHLRTHIEHRCTICNKQFKWNSQLVAHMNIVHFKTGRSFQCHLCGKRYFHKSFFRLHLQSHNPKKQYLCNVCDKRFSFATSLRKHLMTHVQQKMWTCNYCGRRLKYEKSLHKHIEIFHQNKGRFGCDICNKSFWQKNTLEKHKYRIHRIVGSRTEQSLE